jgi:hypothetical protein
MAIARAVQNEKRSLAYVEGVLKGWKRDGLTDPAKQNGKRPGSPQQGPPAIDERAVDATKKTMERKWDFTPAPPPDARPQIKQLAAQKRIRK